MAIDYYQNLTHEEQLDRIGDLLAQGIYLYSQKKNDEPQEFLDKKKEAPLTKSEHRRNVNLASTINPDEKILTIKETTEFLKISRTTLWRLRKHEELPYCIISNRKLIRFKLSQILSCIATKNSLDRKI